MKFSHAQSCIAVGLALLFLSSHVAASPTLKRNSHGHEVFLLQQKLMSIGYRISSADGVFGPETERAVTEFQRDQNIKATGIVTNTTWRALKDAKKRKWGTDTVISGAGSKGSSAPYNTLILERGKVKELIATAKKYIGTPYAFGGTTPKGFDCSGYLQFIFAKHGIQIPRLADDQYRLGKATKSAKQLVPGDLVFFTTYEAGASHCGLYLGEGKFIHASSSKGIRIDKLADGYWGPRYYGGKHIVK